MSAQGEQPSQHEEYLGAIYADAMNWLNVVGHDMHTRPMPDTPYNRANSQVLSYLGDMMAEGDFVTATLLSNFERQARQATSETEWISDAEAQNTERTNTFNFFARAMNRYSGRPYNN